MSRRLLIPGFLALTLVAPRPASAITIDQVVALAKAGVTDTVILALIDRDRTVFSIEPEQVVTLQRDGLSEPIILAMLKSGRAEGEAAARADAVNNASWIMASMPTEPATVIVGHGPDRPNTPHVDGFYSGPPAVFPAYYGGAAYPASRSRASLHRLASPSVGIRPETLCLAEVNGPHSLTSLSFVTKCPAVMQQGRR